MDAGLKAPALRLNPKEHSAFVSEPARSGRPNPCRLTARGRAEALHYMLFAAVERSERKEARAACQGRVRRLREWRLAAERTE